MKKILGVLIVAAVVAIAVIIGTKLIAPKEAAMADILPQDVSFYYSIQNLETIWKNVKTSNFWREFSGLKLWQDIQIASGIQDLQNQFKENIGVELTEENFLKLAGRELVVAIIPAEEAAPPRILLVSRGKNKQTLTDIVTPIIDKVKKVDPAKVEETQYQGKTISHIKTASADQPDIYFTTQENILIVGVGDTLASIQKTLDISSGASSESLSESENYKKIIGLIGEKKELAGLFYMDFIKMRKYFQALTLPGPEGTPTQIATGMETMNYVGGWTEIKDGLITKLYIYPNTEALTPEMKKMWQAEPQVPATLRFTPEKVLLYIASGTLDLPAIWDMWQTNLKAQAPEQAQPILENIANFEKEWGIDIESDVLTVVGNEVAFVFSDINTEGFMPIPKLGLALKVTDKTKANTLIADLIRKNNEKAASEAAKVAETVAEETPAAEEGTAAEAEPTPPPVIRFQINLKEETYEGKPIQTLQLPLIGTGLAPGYTYIDDYLVIGATTKTLQEMMDVKNGKIKPLTQDPSYQKLSSILPEKNNQASYINMERLMDIAVGICNWVVSFQQLTIPQGPPPEDPKELELYNQQKAQGEATIATINNNVIPLLKTLRAVKLVATASENKADHIIYLSSRDNRIYRKKIGDNKFISIKNLSSPNGLRLDKNKNLLIAFGQKVGVIKDPSRTADQFISSDELPKEDLDQAYDIYQDDNGFIYATSYKSNKIIKFKETEVDGKLKLVKVDQLESSNMIKPTSFEVVRNKVIVLCKGAETTSTPTTYIIEIPLLQHGELNKDDKTWNKPIINGEIGNAIGFFYNWGTDTLWISTGEKVIAYNRNYTRKEGIKELKLANVYHMGIYRNDMYLASDTGIYRCKLNDIFTPGIKEITSNDKIEEGNFSSILIDDLDHVEQTMALRVEDI